MRPGQRGIDRGAAISTPPKCGTNFSFRTLTASTPPGGILPKRGLQRGQVASDLLAGGWAEGTGEHVKQGRFVVSDLMIRLSKSPRPRIGWSLSNFHIMHLIDGAGAELWGGGCRLWNPPGCSLRNMFHLFQRYLLPALCLSVAHSLWSWFSCWPKHNKNRETHYCTTGPPVGFIFHRGVCKTFQK